jgi:NADP-dependent alcohol dehydrogenase
MNNFEAFNPVKVIFGKEQIAKIASAIPAGKKVMAIYGGGSIKKNGIYDQVMGALNSFDVIEFSGVEANPKYDTLMKAVEMAKIHQVDFLLAIGGGSVIDGTKFISAAIHHDTDPWNILTKREKILNTTDFGVVLTLPATGSEMNAFSVVTRGKDKLSFGGDPRLYAKFAVLDPEVTYSLPERQLGNGIVDAFIHTTEQYLTTNINTPIQDRFAEGILQTLIEEAPKVLELKEDYDSRANMMWAATNALNGHIGNGVVQDWATHMIGHELTALYNIDHARTLALILPSLLRVQKDSKKKKLVQFAERVWKISGGTPETRIEEAINRTEDFFNSVGLPTRLKVYKLGENEVEEIITSLKSHIPGNLGENQDLDETKIREILTMAI